MIIYLAADHAGFFLKEKVKEDFLNRGFVVEDFGANNFDENDNYPDFIIPCLKKFINKSGGDTKRCFAFVFGGSGTGEMIVANKIKGVRCALFNSLQSPENLELVKLSRQHNNVNCLSFGARFVDVKLSLEAIKIFMTTDFEGGRHAKRILKVDML